MKQTRDAKFIQVLSYGVAAVFLLLPFHALLTTWAGSIFGYIDLFRIWKELLLLPLVIGVTWLLIKDRELRKNLKNNNLIWLIELYIALHILLGILALKHHKVNSEALVYSWLVNLRFLIFFVICAVIASKNSWIIKKWQRLILLPAAIVVAFGLIQQFVLPNDFLKHFGYSKETIPAIHTVDQNPDFVRIQSTMRGPNPLGAYLLLIISAVSALFITSKQQRYKMAGLKISAALALFFTYSRSAWLGATLSVLLVIYWLVKKQKIKHYAALVTAILIILVSGTFILLKNNAAVENTLLHTSQTSRSPDSSNEVRVEAWSNGVKSVINQPEGRGPGTAGPASFRNDQAAPRIAENYYIQIGQEVGIAGLTIFVAISIIISIYLWHLRNQTLSIVLLASFIGLTLVNLLSHAWTDDTLAYIWWGLAGLVLGPSISGTIKQNAKTHQKRNSTNNRISN